MDMGLKLKNRKVWFISLLYLCVIHMFDVRFNFYTHMFLLTRQHCSDAFN